MCTTQAIQRETALKRWPAASKTGSLQVRLEEVNRKAPMTTCSRERDLFGPREELAALQAPGAPAREKKIARRADKGIGK